MSYNLQTERCVIIFDMHQHVGWVRRILKQEEGSYSHLLLGGDYFDTKSKNASSLLETCEFLLELHESHKGKITFLLGNHDIHYLEGRHRFIRYRNPRNLSYKVTGYTNNRGKKINKLLGADFWSACQLFQYINGYLVSHAGLALEIWNEFSEQQEPLAALDNRCRKSLNNIWIGNDNLLMAGKCRGGDASIGGITWLDWDDEFEDNLPWPQIVGHTSSKSGARQRAVPSVSMDVKAAMHYLTPVQT